MSDQENDNNQIIIRNDGGLNISSEYKSHPIKTRIMTNVLGLTKVKKYQIGDYEFNEPDYKWILQTYENFKIYLVQYFDPETTSVLDVFVEKLDPQTDNGKIIEIDTWNFYIRLQKLRLQKLLLKRDFVYMFELDEPEGILSVGDFNFGLIKYIKRLNIGGNLNIEIADLSDCIYLEELELRDFIKIKQLILPNNLDLLKELYICGKSNLEILDLNNCKQLEKLSLWVRISKLILPNNISSLKELELWSNYNMEILDLSLFETLEVLRLGSQCKIKKLVLPNNHIALKHFSCCAIDLEILDLINFTHIEIIGLFYGSKMTKLILPNSLIYLKVLELRTDYHFEIIDLSDCVYLEELYLGEHSKIRQLILTNNLKSLKKLELFTPLNLITLDLSYSENLEELNIDLGKTEIRELVLYPSLLKSLTFYGRDQNIDVLNLSECSMLSHLYFRFGDKGSTVKINKLILPDKDLISCDRYFHPPSINELELGIFATSITTLYCTEEQKYYLEETDQLDNIENIVIISESTQSLDLITIIKVKVIHNANIAN